MVTNSNPLYPSPHGYDDCPEYLADKLIGTSFDQALTFKMRCWNNHTEKWNPCLSCLTGESQLIFQTLLLQSYVFCRDGGVGRFRYDIFDTLEIFSTSLRSRLSGNWSAAFHPGGQLKSPMTGKKNQVPLSRLHSLSKHTLIVCFLSPTHIVCWVSVYKHIRPPSSLW